MVEHQRSDLHELYSAHFYGWHGVLSMRSNVNERRRIEKHELELRLRCRKRDPDSNDLDSAIEQERKCRRDSKPIRSGDYSFGDVIVSMVFFC